MNSIQIYPGAWYLSNALSLLTQKRLIKFYKSLKDSMYFPKIKSGHYMNLQMNSLGWHWNAIDYKYYKTRNDIDDRPVKDINPELINIAKPFSEQLFPYHNPTWDVCLINYYNQNSTLGMHRDNSETERSLLVGHPVVSFSVGASCIFTVGGYTRSADCKKVQLNSGDVFIFGDESRLRFHGVSSILQNKAPFNRFLNGGRINFTLRKL